MKQNEINRLLRESITQALAVRHGPKHQLKPDVWQYPDGRRSCLVHDAVRNCWRLHEEQSVYSCAPITLCTAPTREEILRQAAALRLI